jgi:hypothetical protein
VGDEVDARPLPTAAGLAVDVRSGRRRRRRVEAGSRPAGVP